MRKEMIKAAQNGIIKGADQLKLNAITLNGTSMNMINYTLVAGGLNFPYFECSLSPATVEKKGNTVNNANFTFAQQKYVEFMLQADNTASNPTLNLNNTGARPIGYSYASTWNAMPYRVSGTELVAGSYIMQCIIGGRWSTQQWYIIRTAPYRFYLNRLKMDLGLS